MNFISIFSKLSVPYKNQPTLILLKKQKKTCDRGSVWKIARILRKHWKGDNSLSSWKCFRWYFIVLAWSKNINFYPCDRYFNKLIAIIQLHSDKTWLVTDIHMLIYIFLCKSASTFITLQNHGYIHSRNVATNFPGGNKRIEYIFFMVLSKYAKVISKSIYRS